MTLSRLFPTGLRPRLLLLIAFVVGCSTTLMVYQAAQRRDAAIQAAASEAVLLSRLAAAYEERTVVLSRQALHGLAASAAVRGGDARATRRLLDRTRDGPVALGHLAVAGPDGRVYASTREDERGDDVSDEAWFRLAVSGEGFAIGRYRGGLAEGRDLVRCSLPVRDARGRLVAVVAGEMDTDWLRRATPLARRPEHTSFLVVDAEGGVLAGHPPLGAQRGDSVLALARATASPSEWTQVVRGGDGHSHLVVFTPLTGRSRPALFVGVSIDRDAVIAEATGAFRRSLATMLLVGLLVSAIAWFGVKVAVIRRVEALLAATDRVGAGDLSARTGLAYGRGELTRLARAFDEMTAELQAEHEVRARTEAHLRASEAHKSAVLESSLDGILVLDETGHVMECNAAARRLFGCEGRDCVRHRASDLFGDVPLPSAAKPGPAGGPVEALGRRMDGSTFPVEVGMAPIRDRADRHLLVATVRDLTERKRWERSVQQLTFVDELTGLYNRRGFKMFASQAMRLAARTGRDVVLVSIDLDGLKAINDTFGHVQGDHAIHEMAVILRQVFRESDVLARFGGDEFVALATETEAAGAESSLERLAEGIARRNERGDLPWKLGASFGWTRIDPGNAPPLAEVLEVADARMYEAKRAARGEDATGEAAPSPPPPEAERAGPRARRG